jgi:hypothetical protein
MGMKRQRNWKTLGALFILLMGNVAGFSQPDDKTRDLLILAKADYNSKNFLQAANDYELLTQRPQNESSTFSWYMVGMAY